MRVTRYGMRKESVDLSKRDCLIANLDNRERALRYSFTHIPYLALSRHSRIEERGTWNLLFDISTFGALKRFPITFVPHCGE